MKTRLLIILSLLFLCSIIIASDIMLPGPQPHGRIIPGQASLMTLNRLERVSYNFSIPPTTLFMSYYDYMIGGYNDLPLCVEPNPSYGGYFLTFHGKRSPLNPPAANRRVFYAYISDTGAVQNMNEATNENNWEGMPSMSIDPISGKPMYAWHAQLETASDPYDVQFAYDAFLEGAAGLMSEPVTVVDNPVPPQPPYNTTDDAYYWPTVQIGPSPIPGMRRVYILNRNSKGHVGTTTYASENVWIVYADFNADSLEAGSELTWSNTSIPLLSDWNHANDNTYRRPNCAFTVGNDGRIYYVGYHTSGLVAPEGALVEPDLDAFVCDNYGQGTWTRIRSNSEYQIWNPKTNFGEGPGWITQSDGTTVVPDDSLYLKIVNSAHLNAAIDNATGLIHSAALWAPGWREGLSPTELSGYYVSDMQIVKDLVYDTDSQSFSIREIYPIAGTSTDNLLWLPWDNDGDGEEDEFITDNTSTAYGYPVSDRLWPFPYWDSAAHTNLMFFHYGNVKITNPNSHGMMVAVWQESNRARLYIEYPDDYPELAPFEDTPEIMIACSHDSGLTWSEPFSLNKVETPQLAGMKPMWVYPADQVKFVSDNNQTLIGKLGLMFYDDISWGSFQQESPIGQNDGGYVKFAELTITFTGEAAADEVITPSVTLLKQNYPNPFNPDTNIEFTMPKNGKVNLSIFNAKGQLVKTIVNSNLSKGEQKFKWNGTDDKGRDVANGLYFYKLQIGGKTETRKMMLMK